MLNFGDALLNLGAGNRVARAGWNGKGMFLFQIEEWDFFVEPNDLDQEVLPFIAMKTADNKIVPWLASQTDMLAEDWDVVG